jgi:hypothetical protein
MVQQLQEMRLNHSKSCNMKPLKINTAQSELFKPFALEERAILKKTP